MVRGRKRDVSAPLTRSLVLQRDYRARKAKYVTELESRCQKLENENSKLSKEVEELKSQLRQNEMERKEAIASLTTEAELEKAHALNDVLLTLSSAAASIKSFQNLTIGPDYCSSEDSLQCDGKVSGRKSTRPRPSPSSSTPLNFSVFSPNDPLRTPNNGPIQLYSPISNTSTSSRSLSRSSYDGGNENWNDMSSDLNLMDQGLPVDIDMDLSPSSLSPRHYSNRSGPQMIDLPQSSPPLPRVSSTEDPPPLPPFAPSFRNGRSARSIPPYNRIHGSSSIPYTPNVVLPLGIHPMASYERTLSQSLRNFV